MNFINNQEKGNKYNNIPCNIEIGEWVIGYIENERFLLAYYGLYFFVMSGILLTQFINGNLQRWIGYSFLDARFYFIECAFLLVVSILLCIYLFAVMRDIGKLRMLKQIALYPCTSCQRALCMHVMQMNMIGISYTFRLCDKPKKEIHLNAWSRNHYIFNIKEGDEVYLIEFLHHYKMVLFSRRWGDDNWKQDFKNAYSVANMNKKQRSVLLIGTLICTPLLLYLFYFSPSSDTTKMQEIFVVIEFIMIVSMHALVYKYR